MSIVVVGREKKSNAEGCRRYRERHPDRVLASYNKHRMKIVAYVREQKNKPCTDCGERFPFYAMQFDHVRGKKLFSLGNNIRGHSWPSIKAEIAKCEVVCANCHAGRTYARVPKRITE